MFGNTFGEFFGLNLSAVHLFLHTPDTETRIFSVKKPSLQEVQNIKFRVSFSPKNVWCLMLVRFDLLRIAKKKRGFLYFMMVFLRAQPPTWMVYFILPRVFYGVNIQYTP